MRHIPYGYRIENGRAIIDEKQAATVREFFQNYISGMALMRAAEKVGLNLYHGSAGRMLRNKKYLGDDYYPAIIDKETFDIIRACDKLLTSLNEAKNNAFYVTCQIEKMKKISE